MEAQADVESSLREQLHTTIPDINLQVQLHPGYLEFRV